MGEVIPDDEVEKLSGPGQVIPDDEVDSLSVAPQQASGVVVPDDEVEALAAPMLKAPVFAQTQAPVPEKPKGWEAVLEDLKRGPSMSGTALGPVGQALDVFQSVKQNVLDPQVIDPAQDAARAAYSKLPDSVKYVMGTPLWQQGVDVYKGEIPEGAVERAEANARKWGSLVLGDPNDLSRQNQMSEEARLKGINARGGGTNPILDGAMDFAASEVPKLPLYMAGGGAFKEGEAAGALTKAAIHGVEGAIGGVLGESVVSGGDVKAGAGAGLTLGAGGSLLGTAGKALGKKVAQVFKPAPRTLGVVHADQVPALREAMKAAPEVAPKEKLEPAAILVTADEAGNPVAREVGFMNEAGEMVGREIPAEDAAALAKKKGVPVMHDPEVAPSPADAKVVSDAADEFVVDPNKTPLQRAPRPATRDVPVTEDVKREFYRKMVDEPGFYEAQVERVREFEEKGTKRQGQRVIFEPDGSTVRFETLDDPALQREAMRRSGLVELNDGKLAYLNKMGETHVLFPLENGHPRSIESVRPMDAASIKRGFNVGGEPHNGGIPDAQLDAIVKELPENNPRSRRSGDQLQRRADEALAEAQATGAPAEINLDRQIPGQAYADGSGNIMIDPPQMRPPQDPPRLWGARKPPPPPPPAAEVPATGGGGEPPISGNPPPPQAPPPPPPGPHGIPPELALEAETFSRLQKMGNWIRDQLIGPHSYGPKTVAAEALRLLRTKKGGLTTPEHYMREAELIFGAKARGPEFQKDLKGVLENYIKPEEFALKYPEMAQKAQKELARYRLLIENNNAKLKALGAPVRDLAGLDDSTVLGHLYRGYAKNALAPGEWAQKVRIAYPNAIARLRRVIVRDLLSGENFGGKSPADKNRLADDIIAHVIGDEKYLKEHGLRGLVGNKAADSLKARADLRPQVDELLSKFPEEMKLPAAKNLVKARQTGADIKPRAKALLKALERDQSVAPQFVRAVRDLTEGHELSRTFRAAMGEITDPTYLLGQTLARQEANISALSVWDHMVKYGPAEGTFVPQGYPEGAIPNEGWTRLPDDKARYGNAAGGWMKESVRNQLDYATEASKDFAGWLGKYSSWVKFMQVPGAVMGAVWNQTIGNLQGLILSSRPKALTRFGEVIRNEAAWERNPSYTTEAVRRHKLAIEFGFTDSGFLGQNSKIAANEWKNDLRKLLVEKMREKGHVSAWDVLDLQSRKLANLGGKGRNLAGMYVGAPDKMFKIAAFLDNLELAGLSADGKRVDPVKAAEFLGDAFNPAIKGDALRNQIEKAAALRVSDSFTMLDITAPGMKKINTVAGVVGNPYLNVIGEQGRNLSRAAQRLMEGEPQMRERAAVYAAIVGGGVGGMWAARNYMGMPQEEVDRAFARLPVSDRLYKPGMLALPMRDYKGDPIFIDMTQALLPISWMGSTRPRKDLLSPGGPQDMMSTVLRNIAFTPVNGGFAEKPIAEALAQLGILDDLPFDPQLRADQMNGFSLVDELWNTGHFGPVVVPRVLQNLQQAGVVGALPPGQAPISPGMAAARIATGNHISSPQTQTQSMQQDFGKYRADTKFARTGLRRPEDAIEGPATLFRNEAGLQESAMERYIRLRTKAMQDLEAAQKAKGLR